MKHILSICISMFCFAFGFSQEIQVEFGNLNTFELASKNIDTKTILVWTPSNYNASQKYAVLYMHDGQALFDANTTWNKQAWEVDQAANKLMQQKNIKPFIVVGVFNHQKNRHAEYFPQKPFESLSASEKKIVTDALIEKGRIETDFAPYSDKYLKFLVEELKPFIDKKFSTLTNAKNTFIAGSSMGGLISLYAICEYPKVFGGAACLSTHWPGIFRNENNPAPQAFFNYIKKHLPSPANHKIYFDYGDQTLDALYPIHQKEVDKIMTEKDFDKKNWQTIFFQGKDHSENAWKERLTIPLGFLLKK